MRWLRTPRPVVLRCATHTVPRTACSLSQWNTWPRKLVTYHRCNQGDHGNWYLWLHVCSFAKFVCREKVLKTPGKRVGTSSEVQHLERRNDAIASVWARAHDQSIICIGLTDCQREVVYITLTYNCSTRKCICVGRHLSPNMFDYFHSRT